MTLGEQVRDGRLGEEILDGFRNASPAVVRCAGVRPAALLAADEATALADGFEWRDDASERQLFGPLGQLEAAFGAPL